MKVSAALQILTTVMSGADDWSSSSPSSGPQPRGDFAPRGLDLDLGACLDVETLEEFSHNMYNDVHTQPQPHDNAWEVDNVIDMTSSTDVTSSSDLTSCSELTSSGDHGAEAACVVPTSSSGLSLLYQSDMSALDNLDFMDGLTSTDNATFLCQDSMGGTSLGDGESSAQDLAQFGSAQFGSLSSSAAATTTTMSTIDLTALEQFVTMDVDIIGSKQEQPPETSAPGNIPSSLWNLDLTLPGVPEEEEEASSSSSAVSKVGAVAQDVKESLKNRLYSRGSLHSVSQDSDVSGGGCSRSVSSPTSSLTQSFDEDDTDDPVKLLEKREKNRVAAQKCRNKKREKAETLQKNVARLEERQERLKEEVQKLRDERETLEDIINIHGIVCPKIRKISSSTDS